MMLNGARCSTMLVVQVCRTREAAWAASVLFTCAHISANIVACKSIELATFNRQRAQLVVQAWLRERRVLTPHEVAAEESVFYFGGESRGVGRVGGGAGRGCDGRDVGADGGGG